MDIEDRIEKMRALWNSGLSVSALEEGKEILKMGPEDEYPVLILLGNALTVVGRFSEALDVNRKALNAVTGRRQYSALSTMAYTYYQMGNCQEAITWYEKAFEIRQRPVDMAGYADCLIKLGKPGQVISLLTEFIKTSKPSENVFYELGCAYRALEDYQNALDSFTRVLDLNSSHDIAIEAIKDIKSYLKIT